MIALLAWLPEIGNIIAAAFVMVVLIVAVVWALVPEDPDDESIRQHDEARGGFDRATGPRSLP